MQWLDVICNEWQVGDLYQLEFAQVPKIKILGSKDPINEELVFERIAVQCYLLANEYMPLALFGWVTLNGRNVELTVGIVVVLQGRQVGLVVGLTHEVVGVVRAVVVGWGVVSSGTVGGVKLMVIMQKS